MKVVSKLTPEQIGLPQVSGFFMRGYSPKPRLGPVKPFLTFHLARLRIHLYPRPLGSLYPRGLVEKLVRRIVSGTSQVIIEGTMTLDNIYDYFRTYDEATFAVFACQGQEPTETDIVSFERECGFRLPDEFRKFTMSPLGGLYIEAREEFWPRAKIYDVGPHWSFLYAVKVFGIARDIPEWLDLCIQYLAMRDEGYPHLVPFLQVQCDANCYCFDARGRILYWDHEEPEEQRVESISFSELLLREIRDLEDRTARKWRGGDKHGEA
jgi:hypothetical protein